jgi:hypothetical protein
MAEWDKKDEESARAYSAFIVYRDLGSDRSLAKAGKVLGKGRGTLERWAARFKNGSALA